MPEAVVDTTVLFAAAYPRDTRHEEGFELLRAFDGGNLPEAVVIDYVLAETLNGLNERAGSELATDFLTRLEESGMFHVRNTTTGLFADAKAVFRRYEKLSFVDAVIIAYMRDTDLDYLYSFDEGFDVAEVHRLDEAVNPFEPS
jgi:predicted nucleic acid-binding protein